MQEDEKIIQIIAPNGDEGTISWGDLIALTNHGRILSRCVDRKEVWKEIELPDVDEDDGSFIVPRS